MTESLVSAIVPVYNGENYLREALDSILAQSWGGIEIVIVDDGSTDGTSAIASEYSQSANVIYVYQENSGSSAAMNKGVAASRGEFLAFIDHDDLWDPTKTIIQIQALAENSQLDVVFGHLKNFSQDDTVDKLRFPRQPIPGIATGCMLIRKSSFLRVGNFDTKDRKGNFWPWYEKLKQMDLKILLVDDVLLHRRVHGENWSICTGPEDYSDYFAIIRSVRKQRGNDC